MQDKTIMQESDVIQSIAGGSLIGIAAVFLMYFNGRISGISGILKDCLTTQHGDRLWRISFLSGLILAPINYELFTANEITVSMTTSPWLLIIAGTLVGIGTSIGNGCTSGHGVCGIARFSKRSIIATATFMLVAVITVWLTNSMTAGIT